MAVSGEGDDHRGAAPVARIDALAGVPVVDLAAGGGHAACATATGEAWAWGRDEHGQCGGLIKGEDHQVPTRVRLPARARVDRVAAGRAHTVFLTRRGGALGCGRNHAGQLGLENRDDVVSPQPCFAELGDAVVVAAAGGDAHSLAATADGRPDLRR